MIDTDKYEGHTPAPWMVDEGNGCTDIREADGPTVIASVIVDDDYDLEMKNEMLANAKLIADAPLILQALIDERAEVKRLRGQLGQLGQARECLWWCYDNERFGWNIDEQMWEIIGRLLGADTDHNDNEWKIN